MAKPIVSVSTAEAYGGYDRLADSGSEIPHPDIDGQIAALEQNDLYGMAARMGNVLETVTIPSYPVIEDIKKEIKRMGAVNAMMSGSGPTVFGLFDDRGKARKAYEKLKKGSLAKQVYLTEFFGGNAHDR